MDRRSAVAARPRERLFRNRTGAIARVRVLFSRWWECCRQRRALAELDDHLLRDIGVSRDAAEREARKPFWKR